MTLTTKIAWDDTVLPFQLDRSDIRGRVARLDQTLDHNTRQHGNYRASSRGAWSPRPLADGLIGKTIKLRLETVRCGA